MPGALSGDVCFIMNHRAVFAVNHKYGLLNLDAFYFIGRHRKRIEAKLFEIVKFLRVDNTWIAVGGQIETFPSIHSVSSSLERRTNRPTGRRVFKPTIVDEAKPPSPLVSSHSRRSATSGSLHAVSQLHYA